jgi:hypothetical protein
MERTVRLLNVVNQLIGSSEPRTEVRDRRKLVAEAQKLGNDLFKLDWYKSRQVLKVVST